MSFRDTLAGTVPHLRVNLTVDRSFDYRFLFGLVSLAMRHGGRLERCNASGAEFAFPHGKVADFMGEVGTRAKIRRTWVSPRDRGGSHVNVRFGDRFPSGSASVTSKLR